MLLSTTRLREETITIISRRVKLCWLILIILSSSMNWFFFPIPKMVGWALPTEMKNLCSTEWLTMKKKLFLFFHVTAKRKSRVLSVLFYKRGKSGRGGGLKTKKALPALFFFLPLTIKIVLFNVSLWQLYQQTQHNYSKLLCLLIVTARQWNIVMLTIQEWIINGSNHLII